MSWKRNQCGAIFLARLVSVAVARRLSEMFDLIFHLLNELQERTKQVFMLACSNKNSPETAAVCAVHFKLSSTENSSCLGDYNSFLYLFYYDNFSGNCLRAFRLRVYLLGSLTNILRRF